MRNLGLDLLRFVAIFLVLGAHLRLPPGANECLAVWNLGGWIGVDLFFVLSGFLVSGLLFREYLKTGAVDIKRFLIRRGFKLYPSFYLLILVSLVVVIFEYHLVPRKALFGEVFFLQNYVGGMWNHTWSLAVEEHFYIGLSMLTVFLISHKKEQSNPFSKIPAIFITTTIVCLLLRIANSSFRETFSQTTFLFPTHLRIDSLMFGVYLSYLWHFTGFKSQIGKVPWYVLLCAGFVLLSPAFIYPVSEYRLISIVGVISFYLGSGCLLLLTLRLNSSPHWTLSQIGGLGRASYSIYLWHMAVQNWLWPLFIKVFGIDSFAAYISFYLLGSLLLGSAMGRLVEWPVLKARNRMFPA